MGKTNLEEQQTLPSDGRQTVRIIKAEGYEFIKVYSGLNIETYKAIVDEANKQGLKIIGHIPNAFRGKLKEAFVPHFGMVAHAEEFSKQTDEFSDQDAKRFAQLAKENGTWLTPTLTTMVWIASQARSLDELQHYPVFNMCILFCKANGSHQIITIRVQIQTVLPIWKK